MEPNQPTPEETDLWWGSFAGRSLAPSFVVCVLLTGLLYGLLRPWGRGVPYVPVGVLWGLQLLRWAYRVAGWNYRITTRRLFCATGFRRQGTREIALDRVKRVVLERGVVERLVRVGRIRVVPEDGSAALVLQGVTSPEHVTMLLRAAVERARRG